MRRSVTVSRLVSCWALSLWLFAAGCEDGGHDSGRHDASRDSAFVQADEADTTAEQLGLILIEACREGDLPRVRNLVLRGADVNTRGARGRTALHEFFNRRNWKIEVELLEFLLQHGADREARDADGLTPIHLAAERGRTKVMRALLTRERYSRLRDSKKRTPLHLAAGRGNIETIVLLVAHGADPDARDADGMTALHASQKKNEIEAGRLLVSLGAGPEIEDGFGQTPAGWLVGDCAKRLGRLAERSALGENDHTVKDVCLENERLKEATLFMAALRGQLELVEFLLSRGARVDAPGIFCAELEVPGARPIHAAAWAGNGEIVSELILAGADLNIRDSNGWTALHWAAWKNRPEIAEMLLSKGARPGVKNKQGKRAFDLLGKKRRPKWSKLTGGRK